MHTSRRPQQAPPRVGFLTYDLQPFTEDCLFRLARAASGCFTLRAYPVVCHPEQAKARIDFRASTASGRYFGLDDPGVTPEGFAANLGIGTAWDCVRESDVIVLFGLQGGTALLVAGLARVARRPLVSVNQTLPLKYERRRRWWVRSLKQLLLAQCEVHVYQNAPAAEVLTDVYRVSPDRLVSAPFEAGAGIFAGRLAASSGRTDARRQFGIGDGLACVFVGNLHPFKGVPTLLQAVSQLEADSPWRVLLAGPEESRNRWGGTIRHYLRIAADLGISNRVSFLGRLPPDELAALYQAADVVALPTAKDCFPKVLVEGALAGKALITTDACGASGSLVLEGVNGFVVPPGDSGAVAEALTRLSDTALRLRMGAESQRLVAKCCDAQAETLGFLTALKRVL